MAISALGADDRGIERELEVHLVRDIAGVAPREVVHHLWAETAEAPIGGSFHKSFKDF